MRPTSKQTATRSTTANAVLVDSFDDPDVPDRAAAAECSQGFFIRLRFIGSLGEFEARKLDDHSSLIHACFVRLDGAASRQKATSCCLDRRSSEFRVGGERSRVRNRTISSYPISLRVCPRTSSGITEFSQHEAD